MIKNMPPRMTQLGRLRGGLKETKNGKEIPVKSETWIATSDDEVALKNFAGTYGGQVEPWEKGEQKYRLITATDELDVLLPPDPLFTAYERWGSGGCQRRCDGEAAMVAVTRKGKDGKDVTSMDEQPCWCLAKGLVPGDKDAMEKQGACDYNARLKVILPDVLGIGQWMLTTSSFYAVTELPGAVALLNRLGANGMFVPAVLALQARTEKKVWERYERKFRVPTLLIRDSVYGLAGASQRAVGSGAASGVAGALNAGGDTFRESSRPSTIGDFPPHVQAFIYACGEARLTDDDRHAVCLFVSEGRTSSSKELNIGEAGLGQNLVYSGEWRTAIAHANTKPAAQGQIIDTTAQDKPNGHLSPRAARIQKMSMTAIYLPEPQKSDLRQHLLNNNLDPEALDDLTDEQLDKVEEAVTTFSAEADRARGESLDWEALAKDAGVTTGAITSQARKIAKGLDGVAEPTSLDTITDPKLVAAVRGWLDDKKASAA